MQDWKTRTLLVTVGIGVAAGVLAGLLYIRSVEEGGQVSPSKVNTGAMISIGLGALGIIRQIAALGEPRDDA